MARCRGAAADDALRHEGGVALLLLLAHACCHITPPHDGCLCQRIFAMIKRAIFAIMMLTPYAAADARHAAEVDKSARGALRDDTRATLV